MPLKSIPPKSGVREERISSLVKVSAKPTPYICVYAMAFTAVSFTMPSLSNLPPSCVMSAISCFSLPVSPRGTTSTSVFSVPNPASFIAVCPDTIIEPEL